jgi:hypothetical protein
MPGFNAMAGNVRWALYIDKAIPPWDGRSAVSCWGRYDKILTSVERAADITRGA